MQIQRLAGEVITRFKTVQGVLEVNFSKRCYAVKKVLQFSDCCFLLFGVITLFIVLTSKHKLYSSVPCCFSFVSLGLCIASVCVCVWGGGYSCVHLCMHVCV